MNLVTTIPTIYSSIDEETKQNIKNTIYDFLLNKIVGSVDEYHEATEKVNNLFYEILSILPEDKKHLLFKLDEAENEMSAIETDTLIKYLVNNGEEFKNAIVSL